MINVFHIVKGKQWGGAEQYAYDLLSRLKSLDRDFYAEAVCRKHQHSVKRFRGLDLPVSILPLKGKTDFDSPVRLARMLRRGQNIVHVHSFADAMTAVMSKHISENRNVRVVLSMHGVNKPRVNYFSKRIYREIDRFVFSSDLARDSYLSHTVKISPERCLVIRDSIITAPLTSAEPTLRERLNIAPEAALVMFHGRVCADKGVDVALQALARMPREKFHLVVMGEGKAKDLARFKAFIVENQLVGNVTFLGYQTDVQPLLAQCDFGLLPSRVPEALGLANLEYMMLGKAHIATNNGAQPEYVTDGETGLLVPPDNVNATTQAVERLINDLALRDDIGARAKLFFDENLNYNIFFNRMTQLYQELFTSTSTVKR